MPDRDPDMDEILDDIRTLSRGETPERPKEPRAPVTGIFTAFPLLLPAVGLTIVLSNVLARWLELPVGDFRDIASFLPLIIMLITVDDARPTSLRHWLILGATWTSACAASALPVAFVGWLFMLFAPESINGIAAIVAAAIAGAATLVLVLLAADRLFRADNLIFPRDTGEDDAGVG